MRYLEIMQLDVCRPTLQLRRETLGMFHDVNCTKACLLVSCNQEDSQ